MRITQKYLRDRDACYDLMTLEEYVFKGRKWVNHTIILKDKDITTVDKLWLILHLDFIEEKKLHLLACDYAEHVLPIYEKEYPNDNRPRKAIETARLFVKGKATLEELDAATSAAASAAASTAWAAASAAWAAWATAASAAASAARAAASAARAAASAARAAWATAAWAAELEWQLEQAIKVMKEE